MTNKYKKAKIPKRSVVGVLSSSKMNPKMCWRQGGEGGGF